ncbi:MAG: chromosomal replication initiator DnaA [Pseudolabrys sp.]
MNRPRQLALALPHTESFAREDFLPGPGNDAALALIDRWPDWPARAAVLAGPEGSGKSHLGAIWAQTAGARILAARRLVDADLPQALATDALLLEDLAPGETDERALFHLLNLVREHQAYLLITSRVMPVSLPVHIPDLASRLRALPTVAMAPPDDAMLRSLLVKLAADRQLTLSEDVVAFLMARIERSFVGARAAIARLDEEAMRLKRPISRALAAELFRMPGA